MTDNNGKPNHIEDYLVSLHNGSWYGWSDSKNKVYANLIIHPKIWDNSYTGKIHEEGMINNPHSKPTEQECSDGLVQIQTNFDNEKTKQDNDSASGKTKLKDLGLTDDEIKALTGK